MTWTSIGIKRKTKNWMALIAFGIIANLATVIILWSLGLIKVA